MSRAAAVRAGALWSMGAQYAVFAVQFAVSVLISRFFLAPAEMGLFGIALAAAMLVAVLQDFGLTRYIGAATEIGEEELATCFTVSALFAGAVALVILLLARPLAAFYGEPALAPLLAILAATYLFVPLGVVPAALIQREMNFRALALVNLGAVAAYAAVALGLAAAGFSAFALAWSLVAQAAVRGLLALGLSGVRLPRPRLAGWRPVVRFGSGASLLYASGAVGIRAPELVLGRLVGLAAVGLYGRAVSLSGQLTTLVAGAVGGVFTPALRQIRDSGEALGPPYLRVVAGYTAVTWPAMAFLSAAAVPLVLMLYGPVWAEAAPLLKWTALAELCFVALPLHMEVPILLGRMRRLLVLNLVDTAVSIALLVLAATWSLEWAAASRLGYGLAWIAIYARFMQGLTGFSWRGMLAVYGKSAVLALATAAPLLLLYRWVAPDAVGFAALLAAALAGAAGWLTAIIVVRHPIRAELHGLAESLAGALRRRAANA